VELDRPVTKTAPREQLLLSHENRLTLER
jgi:hypothetical protein